MGRLGKVSRHKIPMTRILSEEQQRWNARYTENPSAWLEPDTFLISAYKEYLAKAQPGLALDLAGGAGRNSLWLVEQGWRVKLADVSDVALRLATEKLHAAANGSSPHDKSDAATRGSLESEVLDLHSVQNLGIEHFDLIMVFYFLQRNLFPVIFKALKPGGTLIYRTYTLDRMKVPGGPSDPQYLLQRNELLHAFNQMQLLHYHEMIQGKAAAELVAVKALA